MPSRIPVVDLGNVGLANTKKPFTDDWKKIGTEIVEAFSDIGFVYLSNHGIPNHAVEGIFQSSKEFFSLDPDIKCNYSRGVTDIQGYTAVNRERLSMNADVKQELRESYDVKCTEGIFPDKEVTTFRPAVTTLVQQCKDLTNCLLTLVAIGLGLERSYFLSTHKRMFKENNASCLRILYYPPVPPTSTPGLIRCGQHTDYGTLTLLFQDAMGGLEVLDRAGQWVHADYIPGTVLVNVGDMMQFWTDKKIRATEHRVLVPEEEIKQRRARQSVVFFVHPDDDVLIEPLFDTSKNTPVTAKQHSDKRFKETYQY